MRKLNILLIASIVVMIMLTGSVVAQEPPLIENQEQITVDTEMDFFTKLANNIKYQLQKIGLFTAEGQSRSCSVNPDYTKNPALGLQYPINLKRLAGCDNSALFNIFDSDWNFIREVRYEEAGIISILGSGIIEVYCCPYAPCDYNYECRTMGEGLYCNPTYGSCYEEIPTHTTNVYKCIESEWIAWKTVSYGEDNWCTSISDNNYLDKTGGEHCAVSPSGSWCPSCISHYEKKCSNRDIYWFDNCGAREEKVLECGLPGCRIGESVCISTGYEPPEECGAGDEKCEGTIYYTCVNENWVSQGKVDGKCGYEISPPPAGDCNNGDKKCSDTIYYLCENEKWVRKGLIEGKCGYNAIDGAPSTCIDEEGTFYTEGYATIGTVDFKFLGYESESTSGALEIINVKDLNKVIPGISAKYYENRRTTCCEGLKPTFVDEKTGTYKRTDFAVTELLIPFWSYIKDTIFREEVDWDKIDIVASYSIYVCKPEAEVGFCLEVAHRWLNPITKTDDCQQNTIILIVIIIGGFIAVSRFMG